MGLFVELQDLAPEFDVPSLEQMQRWVDTWFPHLDATSMVVRVVDEAESAQLNQTYRNKTGPTNVLSFPFEPPEQVENEHLGDLVVCAPLVFKEAEAQGKTAMAHWAHLLLHGVLHLLGYDHVAESDALEMEALEVQKLEMLGIPNPYIS